MENDSNTRPTLLGSRFQPTEQETPEHVVQEGSTFTVTIDVPIEKVTILKDNKEVKPSDRIKVTQTSPTTVEIQIEKTQPDDQGNYSIKVDDRQQPLMNLKVVPKPVVRRTMELPQTTFNEGDTLTIKCQFDSRPEETFVFLHNGKAIVEDDRITTTIEENTYTIVVKNLRPKEDEGVYTLQSDHLVLDTPSITVLPKPETEEEEKPETVSGISKRWLNFHRSFCEREKHSFRVFFAQCVSSFSPRHRSKLSLKKRP